VSSQTDVMLNIKNIIPMTTVKINLLTIKEIVVELMLSDGILLDIIIDKRFHALMDITDNDMVYFIAFSSKMQEHMISSDDNVWFICGLLDSIFGYTTSEMFSYESMRLLKSSFMQCSKEFFRFFTIV
jgi:hypothetical protein